MTGLTIGKWHTYRNFGLKMLLFNVSSPEIYEEKLDVPGRNGPLDVSEALTGEPVYKNRTLKAEFDLYASDPTTLEDEKSNIRNRIHGKMLCIIYDKDPNYYYEGRIKVKYEEVNPLFYRVIITADVAPFKLKLSATTVTAAISGSQELACENVRMSVVPAITCDAEFIFTFGDISINTNAGTHIFPDIKFVEGSNILTCTGTGTVTITYQEGAL